MGDFEEATDRTKAAKGRYYAEMRKNAYFQIEWEGAEKEKVPPSETD
jgi:hypothetical protein